MPVYKNEYPILEYDSEKKGIIMPNRQENVGLPRICVMTFFGEVLKEFLTKNEAKKCNQYSSEMGEFPIHVLTYKDMEICVVQAVVGSASIAMMTDYLIGYGVKTIIACGGCGVLCDIPAGDVIIPVTALRDEGASYKYLPPARDIHLDNEILQAIRATLIEYKVPFVECKTWTTDGFFRETPDMVTYRKEEGCQVVEMECAAIAAVARFRGAKFGQLLYSGDTLIDYANYDERAWFENLNAREKLFHLSLEVAKRVDGADYYR